MKDKIRLKQMLSGLGIVNILIAFSIFVLVILILVFTFSSLYKATKENITNDGENVVLRVSREYDNYLLTGTTAINLSACYLESILDDSHTQEQRVRYLEQETGNILAAIDDNSTGLYGYIKGEYLDGSGWVPDADYDPTSRPWYRAAMEKNGEIAFVDPYVDSQTGDMMMTISVLLSDKKSILALDLSLKELQEITESIPEEDLTIMLIDSSGHVVAHTDSSELGKNYLTEYGTLGGMVTKKLLNEGQTQFQVSNTNINYVVYAKQISSGWYCVSLSNSTKFFMPLKRILVGSVISFLIIMALFIGVFLDMAKRQVITKTANQQLESVANIYISIHEIDLVNDTYSTISCKDPDIEKLASNTNARAQDQLLYVLNALTADNSKAMVKEFADMSDLDERLRDTDTDTLEFLSAKDFWCRARFVSAARDSNGKLTHVLFLVETIDTERRQREHLQYLSETDRMTGINNRISGENKIRELLAKGRDGMFVLLDADKFKSINDTFGHNVGDKVIIAIADCLKKAFRGNDVVLRLGGDEFAAFGLGILMESTGQKVIERFFSYLEQVDIPELGDRKICVSAGAAFYQCTDTYSFDELYKKADDCTYESKKHQGNYVTFAK